MRVIVADDDDDTVDVFSEFLELKDVQVVGKAQNGKQAAELYEELKPDIILIDVMMPGYDGFYAIEKIREMDPDAKIIMITADLSVQTKQKLRYLNVSEVFFKPYDNDSVLNAIHSIENGETIFLSM